MADVGFSTVDSVGIIQINRPRQKNAFTLEVVDQIVAFLQMALCNEDHRAIVLTGAGDAFCAGVDLSIMEAMRANPDAGSAFAWKSMLWDRVHRIALTMEAFDRPIIAAVNGSAYGAGMDLALMCDMRFASTTARFCHQYINLGVVPGDGGCYYLPRLVGLGKALEILLSGEPVSADEALSIGLVNRVYPPDQLLDRTIEFASLLASKSPAALRMTKRAAIQSLRLDLRSSLDLISSHMGIVQTLSDTTEAMAAHREHRLAQFKGN